jgi:hypothetical protein
MRLFRQERWCQWEPVFEQVALELQTAAEKHKGDQNFREQSQA